MEPLDIGCREPGPLPDVDFAQPRVEAHFEAERGADDLGGFSSAREIRAVDQVGRISDEPFREPARLLATEVVQRPVGVALPPALAIPVGLAVTGKKKGRRHGG
jgi:hypothetical protein